MAISRYHLTRENLALVILGLLLTGAGVYECRWAYNLRGIPVQVAEIHAPPALPLLLAPSSDDGVNPQPLATQPPLLSQLPTAQPIEPAPAPRAPVSPGPRALPSIASAPLPPSRPADLGILTDVRPPIRRPDSASPTPYFGKPEGRAVPSAALAAMLAEMANRYDRYTAIYDLSAHTVYLPDGARLEAHSGLGDKLDDPRFVNEQDRGATPPHLYDLTMREQLFHGVQALRLNPVGGSGEIFGREGLLAHTYMLGPNGDSNGCVSFKDYDAFLQAFQNGRVKRLAVVARLI